MPLPPIAKGAAAPAVLLVAATLLALPVGPGAHAQTLEESLVASYNNNPQLLAARAQLRAVNEQVPQALAGWRPTVTASGQAGAARVESETEQRDLTQTTYPRQVAVNLQQPVYRGGRTVAATRAAENTVQAQRAALWSTEQQVLLGAATAYMDVVRDQAILELNISNEQVLRRQLEATQDRFEVGELTRTDVSQAEARLARATADRLQAEGNLMASRATYERVVGIVPGVLEAPPPLRDLPESREAASASAVANPAVVAAQFSERAARDTVDVIRGELLPTVSVTGQLSRAEDTTTRNTTSTAAQVLAQVSVPLYEAGAVYSRVRQARETASQRLIEVEDARRQATEIAAQAWEALATARASITSLEAEIEANQIALEGVQQEAAVGLRTVLDVLDAQQELLNAQVNLVAAQRNEVVAGFQLKSAIGELTAQELGLPVQIYDVEAPYRAVRDRWWGTSVYGE